MQLHTASESFHYKVRLLNFVDIWPESLELGTNTREIRFDRGRMYEVAHIDSEEAERIFSWVDGEAMALAKSRV